MIFLFRSYILFGFESVTRWLVGKWLFVQEERFFGTHPICQGNQWEIPETIHFDQWLHGAFWNSFPDEKLIMADSNDNKKKMVKRTALAGCFDHNDDNDVGDMKSKSTLAGCSFSMVLDLAPRSWHPSCGHSLKSENFRSTRTNGIQTEAIWKLWEWFSHLRDDLGGATGPDPGISTWQNQLNKGKARGFKNYNDKKEKS